MIKHVKWDHSKVQNVEKQTAPSPGLYQDYVATTQQLLLQVLCCFSARRITVLRTGGCSNTARIQALPIRYIYV